jgi:hypothetical protein
MDKFVDELHSTLKRFDHSTKSVNLQQALSEFSSLDIFEIGFKFGGVT